MKDIKIENNPTLEPIPCGVLTTWISDKYKIGDNAANEADAVLHRVGTVNQQSTLIPTFIKFIRSEFISFKHALKAANDHHNTFQRVIKEGYDPHLFGVDEDHHEGNDPH